MLCSISSLLQSTLTVFITHSVLQGILWDRQGKNYLSLLKRNRDLQDVAWPAPPSSGRLELCSDPARGVLSPMSSGGPVTPRFSSVVCLSHYCTPGWLFKHLNVTSGHYQKCESWLWDNTLAFLSFHSSLLLPSIVRFRCKDNAFGSVVF